MKKSNQPKPLTAAVSFLAGVAIFFFFVQTGGAGNRTWSGGGANENWTTPANWDVVPAVNDSLFFAGTLGLAPSNDFTAGTIFNNITFTSNAGPFTIGGNFIVLTNGLDGGLGVTTGGSISNSSPSPQSIDLLIMLSAGKHNIETDSGAGQLNINNTLLRNRGAIAVFTPNATINTTGGLMNDFTGIIGGWATLGNGWATLDSSANVIPYASYLPISAGAIPTGASNNLLYSSDTANLTAASGTMINSIVVQPGTTRSLSITGTMKVGSLGGIYRNSLATGAFTVGGGTLTANGGGEISLYDGPFTGTVNDLTVSSIISDDGTNLVSVNVVGYTMLSGNNSFTGGCYISQGRAQTGNPAAFGKGPVFVYQGGEAFLNIAANFSNSFNIYGSGTTESNLFSGPGAIRMNAGTINNTVTLLGGARISTSSPGGPVIAGQINGSGTLELCAFASANSVLVLSNTNASTPNNWSGDLHISSLAASRQVVVKLGANEQIPDFSDVKLNGTDVARFDLNGHNETIGSLNSGAGAAANMQVTNSGTAPATLTMGANDFDAFFAGTFSDAGNSNTLSITKIGTGSQTFTGANNAIGNVFVKAGTLVLSGAASINKSANVTVANSGTLNVANLTGQLTATNNLTLSNGIVTLSVPANPITNFVVNVLSLSGPSNVLNFTSLPVAASYPQTLHIIGYNTLNGSFNVVLGSLPPATPAYSGMVTLNPGTGTVDLVLNNGPGAAPSLTWTGTDPSLPGSWDFTSLNWSDINGLATNFSQGDFTLFDDTATGSTLVNLTTTLTPGGVTVSNNVLNYTFAGSGNLGGSWTLNKQGSGQLILDNGSHNGFAGVNLGGGSLQVGNGDASGDLGSGPVVDNSSLVFQRTDTNVVANVISGSGGVTQSGFGVLVLSNNNNNTFNGPVLVTEGVLQVGTSNSLGSSNGSLTVNNGGSLDLNGNNLASKPIFVSGPGADGSGLSAIDNSGTNVSPAVAFVTLLGNTFLGTSGGLGGTINKGSWSISAAGGDAANPTNAMLSTGGLPYGLAITGGGVLGLISATVDPMLADIDIQGGKLDYEGTTTGLGNPSNTVTIETGASLLLLNAVNPLNKHIQIAGDGTVESSTSANTITGPILLNGGDSLCQFQVDGNSILNLNGPITGNGSLNKTIGTGTLNLNGTNSFSSSIISGVGTLNINGDDSAVASTTTLIGGTLNLNRILGGPIATSAGSTLSGSGTSFGLVDVGGNLTPGGAGLAGTFSALGGFVMENSANVTFDLTANAGVGGSNDLVQVNGNLTLKGGTITINALGTLTMNVPYRLFNYTGTLNLSSIPSIANPAGYSFVLDTSKPGQINVTASGPVTNSYSLSSGFSAFANQVNAGSNTLGEIFGYNVPDGTTVYFYSPTLGYYDTAQFITSFGWFDNADGGATTNGPVLAPGVGVFVYNPGSTFQLNITGTPNVPVLPLNLNCGYSYFLGRQTNGVGIFENITGLQPQDGDQIFVFEAVGETNFPSGNFGADYSTHTFSGGGWVPSLPYLNPHQPAFFKRSCGPSACMTMQVANVLMTNVSPMLVSFTSTVLDTCIAGSNVVNTYFRPPSGSLFSPGTTPVHGVAVDGAGNTAIGDFTVTIAPPGVQIPTYSYMLNFAPGLNLFAYQFLKGGNTLREIMTNVPDGTVVTKYVNGTNNNWLQSTYNAALGAWIPGNIVLRPGDGAFLFNPTPTNIAVLLSGNPNLPVLPIALTNQIQLVSRQTNDIGNYLNIVGVPVPPPGTRVFQLNGTNYNVSTFIAGGGGHWVPSEPINAVGQAYWISFAGRASAASHSGGAGHHEPANEHSGECRKHSELFRRGIGRHAAGLSMAVEWECDHRTNRTNACDQ